MEGDTITPPKTSLLSQKLPGGQALINNIQQKLRHATSIRDLIIALESKVNAGVISLVDLVAAMEEYDVFLDKRECDVLDRRFTNASGDLEYFRLIKTLDIGTPAEHMDPEHFEDILPQPYRMISKILEYEIMDVAWLEILRRHPEVAEDIPGGGGAGVARRNRNLDRECHPSCQVSKSKQVAVMGAGEGPFSFSVNVEGSCQIMDNCSGKILRTLQLFPLTGHTEGDDTQQTAAPGRPDGSLVQRVEISNTSVGVSPHYLCRTAILKIEANLPKPVPEEDVSAGKKGKKVDKKSAPTEEVPLIPFKCSITIVETSGKTNSSFEARVLKSFECMLQESHVDPVLSLDGRVLTISHGMTIEMFKLVPMTQIVDPFNAVSATNSHAAILDIADEEDENMPPENGQVPIAVVQPSLCRWNIEEEISKQSEILLRKSNPCKKSSHAELMTSMNGSRVWRSFIFPFLPVMQWNDSLSPDTPETTGGVGGAKKSEKSNDNLHALPQLPLAALPFQQQQQLSREFQNGLVVFLENVKAFFVFGLRDMSAGEQAIYDEKQKAAIDAAILDAGGSLDGGEANSVVDKESPLLNSNPPFLELITFWSLSGAVTAMDSDSHKSVLVLGQADGVVTLWDLRSLQMTDVPARHHSLVTAVALTSGAKSHSLVSGDVDGTLCFYNLAVPNASKDGDNMQVVTVNQVTSSSIDGLTEVQQCVKAELIDFRTDFTPKEIIDNIYAIPHTAIVIIQLASMKLVAYDAETAELYGRISLTSGIPGQRIDFSLVKVEDAILIYTAPPLTEQEKQRLLEEAEEEAAKAAKGKKGKKEAVPSPDELDMESLVAPEPSPYLVRKNRTGVCCASAHGFCGSFIVDHQQEVISTFSTERLITFFCVGVESVLKQLSLTQSSSFDQPPPSAVDVYRALSKEERITENLRPSQVSSLQALSVGDEASQMTGKNTATMKKSTVGRGATSSTTSNNNVLTEAKLKALQKAYSPFENVSALPDISTYLHKKVPLPKSLFEKSCKQSQSERARRKKALLVRMEALGGMV